MLDPLVRRIMTPKEELELVVRVLREVHLPDTAIVGEERIDGREALDSRLERGTRERERTALRRARGAEPLRVDLRHGGDDAGEQRRVEVNLAEEERVGLVLQAANDVTLQGISAYGAGIVAHATLPAHVERSDDEAGRRPRELVREVTAVHRVTVKAEQCRATSLRCTGAHELRVQARATHAREVEMKAFGEARLNLRGHELDRRFDGAHLGERALPIRVEIRRPRVSSHVPLELSERHVDGRHGLPG